MKIFAERLREERVQRGITQITLSKELQTTNSAVCDWECERCEPSLEMLVAIAKFFEVSVDYLLGLED